MGFGALPGMAQLPQSQGGDPCSEIVDASYEEFESGGAADGESDPQADGGISNDGGSLE